MAYDISEDTLSRTLIDVQGDIFLAASYSGCTVRKMDEYIRRSPFLQSLVANIRQVKADPEYERSSAEQFAAELERRQQMYRIEAVDEIHALAMQPMSENAAMMDVKLKAAVALKGKDATVVVNDERANILAELNRQYLENAPRVKSVRAVQIEFEG